MTVSQRADGNGLRWHVRAFDRNRNRFSDFVLTRITKAKSLEEKSDESEQLGADAQWARLVDLEIAPHPGIAFPEAIEADYGMRDGLIRLQMRAALVGYALNRWNVDCSPNHSLDSRVSNGDWFNTRYSLINGS